MGELMDSVFASTWVEDEKAKEITVVLLVRNDWIVGAWADYPGWNKVPTIPGIDSQDIVEVYKYIILHYVEDAYIVQVTLDDLENGLLSRGLAPFIWRRILGFKPRIEKDEISAHKRSWIPHNYYGFEPLRLKKNTK